MDTTTIWVCIDCHLSYMTGEAPEVPVWTITDTKFVSPGFMLEEHVGETDCYYSECECETKSFDSTSCDGCGSTLAGQRHAYTYWA